MKQGILAVLALVFGLTLAACETMSAEECATADWRGLGFNDAASNGADRYGERAESCAEKGYAADSEAYTIGFSAGIVQFCQPPNGFQFALRGGAFNGSCPAHLQSDFYAAYNDGRRIHDARSELSTAESELSQLERRYNNFEEDIRNSEAALRDATTDEERARLRAEIDSYYRERRDMRDDLEEADRRVRYARRQIDELRYEIGYRWSTW
jgi:hypothetical protein